jgi:hypothetical protein
MDLVHASRTGPDPTPLARYRSYFDRCDETVAGFGQMMIGTVPPSALQAAPVT